MNLPGAEALVREALRAALEEAGRQGADLDDLVARLPEETSRDEAAAAVADLERQGEAAAGNGRWYLLRHTQWQAGVVETFEDGDAVVRPLPSPDRRGRTAGGWFLARRRLTGAVDGDRVLIQPLERKHRKVRGQRLPEATVVRIVQRRRPRLVGTLEIDEDGRWLVPYEPKNPLDIEVVGGDELLEDQYVVVEIESGPAGSDRVRGRVVEVLGSSETPGVDVAVVLRHYDIPDVFSEAILEEAASFPDDPSPEEFTGREDLRELTAVTIDGESARDFDDAVSVERLDGETFRLGVHIADVSHYVPEGSRLDVEAYRRGTSTYFPDRAVPMLPENLSNGLCSLKPGVPRLALSAFLDIDRSGRVRSRRFAKTVIRSKHRLTYEEVRRLLEEPKPKDTLAYDNLVDHLGTMRELMEILLAARMERGSIDFDLPEGDVVLDTDGYVVGITPTKRHVSHRIIEEFMIAANEAVAEELTSRDQPALFRVHDPPDPTDLSGLEEILHNLGLGLDEDLTDVAPAELQEVLARVEGSGEENFVTTLVLRTMQRALYGVDCRGHYALAAPYYTHFTSPIRRYPDLVVHRRLKELVHRGPEAARQEAATTGLAKRLPAIATHTSNTERRAEQAERDILQWKKVRFLADRVGERFEGHITGVQPFGLFVQLDDLYVDGLVPIRTLSDDYYVYQEDSHRLVGENRNRTFQLADSVEVVLTGVTEKHRGLDLEIADIRERKRRGAGQRKGGRSKQRRRASAGSRGG